MNLLSSKNSTASPLIEVKHEQLRNYLLQLDWELRGMLPEAQVEHYLSETAFWIEREALDQMTLGFSEEQAYQVSIKRHGTPKSVADEIVEEQFENEIDTPILNRTGRGNGIAGAIFGMGNTLYLILLQLAITIPSDSVLPPTSPGKIREYFPEPLPFPELSWQFGIITGYPVIAPFILGWICGRMIPVRAAHAAFLAILIITLTAFLMGVALLPNRSALIYAVWQTIFWLPVGCLTAYISSSLARYTRRRKFGSPGYSRAPK